MNKNLKINELNQLKKGDAVFRKDEPILCIGIVIQGSLRFENGGVIRTAAKGAMVSITDLFFGKSLGDYTAAEDTYLYTFPVKDTAALENFLSSNPDYRGIVVHSMAVELAEYLRERERLLALAAGVQERFLNDAEEKPPKELFPLKCDADKVSNYQEYAKNPLRDSQKILLQQQTYGILPDR